MISLRAGSQQARKQVSKDKGGHTLEGGDLLWQQQSTEEVGWGGL